MANETNQLQKVSPLKALEQQMATVKGARDLLKIDFVKDRYIKNFQAISGAKDGTQQYEAEAFAFMDLANLKPEIMNADKYSIVAGFMRAATYGLSFQGNDLSVYVRSNKLVVEPQAHGKRRLLEKMPTIKEVGIGVLIYKTDKIKINPKTKQVTDHQQDWPVPEATPDNIVGAYSTITFTDGKTREVIITASEIAKARAASKMEGGGQLWKTYYGEAVKKTVYNRAFKELWKKPEAAVLFTQFEYQDAEVLQPSGEAEDPEQVDPTVVDASHSQETVPNAEQQESPANVDTETGEVIPDSVPKTTTPRRGAAGKQESFI